MKRLLLKGLEHLDLEESEMPSVPEGFKLLRVLCCAICKTDAKMWHQGHRELVFPRVPGHEMVVADYNYNGDENIYSNDASYRDYNSVQRYAVWPGQSCGNCRYCTKGHENLCEKMKITGFHHDGGFSQFIIVPTASLIPLPPSTVIPDIIGCFAEPVGCVLNAIEKLNLQKGQRVLIYGGGTIGLIAALACCNVGAIPFVIEKKEEKINKIAPFLVRLAQSFEKTIQSIGSPIISCLKDTVESEFDAVINCCADHIAFNLCIAKVAKGGKISFFSGITKNEHIETNLINLLHYKEVELTGAYGLTRKNMLDAISFIETNIPFLEMLVEGVVTPEKALELMPQVLSGNNLKYIIDFRDKRQDCSKNQSDLKKQYDLKSKYCQENNNGNIEFKTILKDKGKKENQNKFTSNQNCCRDLIATIIPVNQTLLPAAQGKIDNKTKPLGALGTLEDIALQMSLVQRTLFPVIRNKALFVFAGDHGITEEGVSAYPSEVTRQMVKNFLNGGAAINILCRHHNIEMKIVDMGVNGEFDDEFSNHPDLLKKKVRKGTRNFAIEPAMTCEEVFLAVRYGMEVFLETNIRKASDTVKEEKKRQTEDKRVFDMVSKNGNSASDIVKANEKLSLDIIGVGEMGIGNTTSASAIISAITGITPAAATGRGTGIDNKVLEHKVGIIKKALDFHKPDPEDGFDILRKIGGYEIAGITGAVLAASSRGCAVVLDGVISTAAGLVAYLVNPDIKGYLISGHKSVEIAQKSALDYMGLKPVVDFGMRLGEGTGAALTINTAEAACKIMCEMASFDEAKVSGQPVIIALK